MKHELASERLLELAYGELPPREARDVEAHASACEACRGELARIRETRALMAQLPVEPPPERGQGIVMAAAREAAAARGRKARSILPPWLWAGSVGAVAVAVVAVVSWQLGKAPLPTALQARDSELMGSPAPAVALAPPPQETAERRNGGEAQPEKRKGAAAGAKRGEDVATADGYAKDRDDAAGLGAIGFGDARSGGAGTSAGRGGGVALLAPAAPPAPAGAASSAPAPKALWAPPAASAPQAAPAPSRRMAAADREEAVAPAAAESAAGKLAEAERCERMPAPSEPAPAPAQQASRAPLGEKKRAAAKPSAAAPAQALRDAGATETRSFEACPGERRRIVERDGDGRVIRYVREGERRTIEHRFSPDGRLISAVEISGGVRRSLPLDAPGLVRLARDAGMDAPPRCESP